MAVQGGKHKDWTEQELRFLKANFDESSVFLQKKLNRSRNSIYSMRRTLKADPDYIEKLEFDEKGKRIRGGYIGEDFDKKVKPIRYKSIIRELKLDVGKEYTLTKYKGDSVTVDTQSIVKGEVIAKYDTFYVFKTGNYTTTIPRWGNDYYVE